MHKIIIIVIVGLICNSCWDTSEEGKIAKGKCQNIDKEIFHDITNSIALNMLCEMPGKFNLNKICELKKKPSYFADGFKVKSKVIDCGDTRLSYNYGPPFEDTVPFMRLNGESIEYGGTDLITKLWGLKKTEDAVYEGIIYLTKARLVYFFYKVNNTYCVTCFKYDTPENSGLCLYIFDIDPLTAM